LIINPRLPIFLPTVLLGFGTAVTQADGVQQDARAIEFLKQVAAFKYTLSQVLDACFSARVWSVSSAEWDSLRIPRLAGVTLARYLLLCANTP